MLKDRENKIPQPRTIARHYSEGKYCDYPADTIMSAVNSYDYDYNPTAIPIRLGFKQMLNANFNAFIYLCEHNDAKNVQEFLNDPDGYMKDAGIHLEVPFDEYAPKIFAAMVEDDMLEAFRSEDDMAVCHLLHSDITDSWRFRHPERYPRAYMNWECYWELKNIPWRIADEILAENGFTQDFGVNLLFIVHWFADK